MAGLVLNKSISLILFTEEIYELLHFILFAFLYILLIRILNLIS